MDEFDRAQELEALHLAASLAAQAAASRPLGASLAQCDDCGEAIPEARRQAAPGCTRCMDCQARAEQRKRGGL
ncbi:TraR/DksA C4-type zinc finger protein [Chromobacterium subtsugae]|uniref:TraR/DksA C4-type zinc finger protein n=1 Tax=Chromobacterium subtsugae TaxID=251747 RepID=A0ABS7FH46_9NEIS|nr:MULTISPECIES: TraR/DksA C4-type zinc finger protein [Chromobacterium]KUM03517.1 conjugal transfer protein TraR [Chromobacterium subtsugae]KZE87564.1 conjugal transfer protein TraR [Chromobacterium sp. F49]MBW7567068.1 TraR/DksA C4-type zinc finger protein [Chromobacterium subtsugae]MBW8288613.1 TraR/DksA C4-type zinc finger protein [Chromobacterium subtsugae]WSE90160.1 TraR/DksA C4-type zinc finger protein [Chromobacterium subtsugae]